MHAGVIVVNGCCYLKMREKEIKRERERRKKRERKREKKYIGSVSPGNDRCALAGPDIESSHATRTARQKHNDLERVTDNALICSESRS